MMKTK